MFYLNFNYFKVCYANILFNLIHKQIQLIDYNLMIEVFFNFDYLYFSTASISEPRTTTEESTDDMDKMIRSFHPRRKRLRADIDRFISYQDMLLNAEKVKNMKLQNKKLQREIEQSSLIFE